MSTSRYLSTRNCYVTIMTEQDDGAVKYIRTVTYGWQDLIGFFGGIVGLCVGFSLLSGAELIYFFTLRLFFDVRNENKVENKDETENVADSISDKEILSESFDAVFSINNSTVQLIDTDEKAAEKNKPDLIPASEKLENILDIPNSDEKKLQTPQASPKKASPKKTKENLNKEAPKKQEVPPTPKKQETNKNSEKEEPKPKAPPK